MNISLIANSGIQFYKFPIKIDPNADIIKTMGFYEYEYLNEDKGIQENLLKYAYYLPDNDIWVSKEMLKEEDYLDENEKLVENINYNIVKSFALKEEKDYYTVGDITDCLALFASKKEESIWLPIPYFKKNNNNKSVFGPIAWARMIIKEESEVKSKIKTYKVILAFDTDVKENAESYFTPQNADTQDGDNKFALCNDENFNHNFCDSKFDCGWVDKHIKSIFVKREGKERQEFPYNKYIAYYLYMLKYLEGLKQFPEIKFCSDTQANIDVDLVLDIGNSNTCGLLFESPAKKSEPFQFDKVCQLKLNDLSEPEKEYSEPFSMRLAFAEAKFGEDIDIPGHKNFRWPSLLRLGKEAARLITKYNLNVEERRETATNHSSPKRYLWDNQKADVQWEFVNFNGTDLSKAIYYEGISEQFKENGEFSLDNFSCTPNYSRKSLMTFVYIEILLHAISQINSFEFRHDKDSPEKPRKLKRITITCPTSIIQHEQVALRECALDAVKALSRFVSDSFLAKIDDISEIKSELEIIPSPKDLSKKLSVIKERKDWIYDEATCGQLVFLYGEISKRYGNKAEVFFDLYGKRRDDDNLDVNEKTLTIGSVDIGGGTTDLMICAYQFEKGQSHAVIKPVPLYWESFNLAGDDLLKDIVQEIILEGTIKDLDNQRDPGYVGVIKNAAIKAGVTDIPEKMLNFFGPNSNQKGNLRKICRKNFIVQVAVPIAIRYLQHAISNLPDLEIEYNDIFVENKPNEDLIKHFDKHFAPLEFQKIKWKLSKDKVFQRVDVIFDPLLKPISALMSAYGCDFVLLTGKPTTIPKIREMFMKYYPVSPEKLITMHNYRIGHWYPFAKETGYFKNIEDTKTIVAVGALIALMGGVLDKLKNFRLNTNFLKRKLISTSDYIGLLDNLTQNIDPIFLNPDENSYEIEIHSLPMTLGYKQLPNRRYRGRPIYKLDFNEVEIREKVLEQYSNLNGEQEISNAIDKYKQNLKNRMPFKVKIKRNWSDSHENIYIDSIKDVNRNEPSKRLLTTSFMTLPDEQGYWLDTGEFNLNIK